MIKVQWFGHSMWKLTTPVATLVTDPFGDIGYPIPRNVTADIVVSSHDHHDHNHVQSIQGNPRVFRQAGRYTEKGVELDFRPLPHDNVQGTKRGMSLLMKMIVGGITFLHCGDLGCIPDDETLDWIGHVDAMFIPTGGFYTVGPEDAWTIVQKIRPAVVFPQHFRTRYFQGPVQPVEDFLRQVEGYQIRWIDDDTVELNEAVWPQTTIMIFKQYIEVAA